MTVCAEGDHAVLPVSDTGAGIPEAEVPLIFDRFHRVGGTRGRTHDGTGIGLALVQELVKLHKDSVAVESTLGRGTTFIVWVPFGSAHLPQAAESTPPQPGLHGDARRCFCERSPALAPGLGARGGP